MNALKREFDALSVDIAPEGVWSPASMSKAFLDSMGLHHPLEKFSLPDNRHGIQCNPITVAARSVASEKQRCLSCLWILPLNIQPATRFSESGIS